MKRKAICFIMVCVAIIGLTACGKKDSAETAKKEVVNEEAGEVVKPQTSQTDAGEDEGDFAAENAFLESVDMDGLIETIPDVPVEIVTGWMWWDYYKNETWERELKGGFVEAFEVVNKSQEAVRVKGIVSNGAFQTEEPIEVIYYVVDDYGNAALSATQVVTEATEIHLVPTVPMPEAIEWLDLEDVSIEVSVPDKRSAVGEWRGELLLTHDNVSEMRYGTDDSDVERLDENRYFGEIYITLINGTELSSTVSIEYRGEPEEWEKDRKPEWIIEGGARELFYADIDELGGTSEFGKIEWAEWVEVEKAEEIMGQ